METEILQKLSESGISYTIDNILYEIWFSLETTDEIKSQCFASVEEGIHYLKDVAIEYYPNSVFTQWWNEQMQTKKVGYGS